MSNWSVQGNPFTSSETQTLITIANGGGSALSHETPSGTVNGTNRVFTVSATPKWIFVEGVAYFENATPGYTRSSLTITFNFDIWSSNNFKAII